jgi:hypothetical protein
VTLLNVGAPINVGTIPNVNVTGCDNFGSITLTADANGGNGLVSMVWQVSTDGGTTWNNILALPLLHSLEIFLPAILLHQHGSKWL